MDPVVIDTNKYHHDLAKYNRDYEDAWEYHFGQVIQDEAFLESVMMDYFAEEYNDIPSLPAFHQQMLWWFSSETPNEFKDKWIERCNEEAKRRVDG
jgi:hypothetical protein